MPIPTLSLGPANSPEAHYEAASDSKGAFRSLILDGNFSVKGRHAPQQSPRKVAAIYKFATQWDTSSFIIYAKLPDRVQIYCCISCDAGL